MIVQISPTANGLQVVELVSFDNISDKVFSTDTAIAEGIYQSVSIPLPANAQIVDVADDPRFFTLSDDRSALIDLRPVTPGEGHLIHVIYTLPFSGNTPIEHRVNYATNGHIQVLLPSSLRLSSDQFTSLGPTAIGSSTFDAYQLNGQLQAGDSFGYTLTGSVGITSSQPSTPSVVNASSILPIVLVVMGAVIILMAGLIYWRGSRTPAAASTEQLIDGLIQQIAELDRRHEKGEIDPDEYQSKRQQFKATLATLMTTKPQDG
jgi:hypothetical protein